MNACHSRFKKWLAPFNGVSTKYLDHYLTWFIRYDGEGEQRQSLDARISAMMLQCMSTPVAVRTWRLTA